LRTVFCLSLSHTISLDELIDFISQVLNNKKAGEARKEFENTTAHDLFNTMALLFISNYNSARNKTNRVMKYASDVNVCV
jgi:hypothetical protein